MEFTIALTLNLIFLVFFLLPIVVASNKMIATHLEYFKVEHRSNGFYIKLQNAEEQRYSLDTNADRITVTIEETPYNHTERKQLVIKKNGVVVLRQTEVSFWTLEVLKKIETEVNELKPNNINTSGF